MKLLLFVIFFLIYPYTVIANQEHLKIGVAQFPPYSYITTSGEVKGLEVEVIRECFKDSSYQIEFIHYPYGRLPIALAKKEIDGQIVSLADDDSHEIYFSDIVVPEYQTVAISLSKNNLQLHSISDLKNHTIVGHQRAKDYYGKEFYNIATKSKENYKEYANQMNQVHLLYSDLTDVIVIGNNIFKYFKEHADFDTSAPIQIDKIFGKKRGFNNAFSSEKVRDEFNLCLKKIKTNGTYQKLVQQALK